MTQIGKIIHIDMDAFFAAVEQRDFPEYRGRPVVVGGMPDSRGVVATCSYEARRFGIRSAMPASHAFRLCPKAVFLRPRFEVYRQVSSDIRAIFGDYTDLVEPLSLDEAYLDVSTATMCHGSATRIALAIKRRILMKTELTASAGVSYNKFLAKIASDINKPDGLYVIRPEDGPDFAEKLPIGRFHGIGKTTELKMRTLGIHTGRDLKSRPIEFLLRHFGKAGLHYYQIARGEDDRPVMPQRPSRSLGAETTFPNDIDDVHAMRDYLDRLMQKVAKRLEAKKLVARTLTIKVKYDDFKQITRSKTVNGPLLDPEHQKRIISELLANTEAGSRKVRLLGITLSSFGGGQEGLGDKQLDLFRQT